MKISYFSWNFKKLPYLPLVVCSDACEDPTVSVASYKAEAGVWYFKCWFCDLWEPDAGFGVIVPEPPIYPTDQY